MSVSTSKAKHIVQLGEVSAGRSEGFVAIEIGSAGRIIYYNQAVTNGIASFAMPLVLARNAALRRFDVVVQARRADRVPLDAVAQVRSSGNGYVIDFGVMRSVAGLEATPGVTIKEVYLWGGMAFLAPPFLREAGTLALFPSEVRTERLRVVFEGVVDEATLAAGSLVYLPEAPSDLELRLDGGPPIWTHPGPVQPGPGVEPTVGAWSRDVRQVVPIADALAAVSGDPLAAGDVAHTLVLTSRVPGMLAVEQGEADLGHIRRVQFNGETSQELTFDAEGVLDVPLVRDPPLPSPLVEEVRFTAIGTPPPERAIDPDGPPHSDAAELLLDPAHAFCVRLRVRTDRTDAGGVLRPGPGLAELTGVRLPLVAEAGGAEARVVLWADAGGEPGEPIEGGTSDPVALDPPPAGADPWTTFPFPRPVPLDGPAPWAAVVVSRGHATWSLIDVEPTSPLAAHVLRRGSAAGPWSPLPAAFGPGGMLARLRGRVRVVGHGDPTAPLAPLEFNLLGAPPSATVAVTPTRTGVAAVLTFAPPVSLAEPVLRVRSRSAVALTLRNIDILCPD